MGRFKSALMKIFHYSTQVCCAQIDPSVAFYNILTKKAYEINDVELMLFKISIISFYVTKRIVSQLTTH